MSWQVVLGGDGPHPLIVSNGGGGDTGLKPLQPYDGGESGPKPLSYHGIQAYAQIEEGTKIKRFAHLAILEFHLFTAMQVQIIGDTGMVLSEGASTQVWSGVNIDPATGFEKLFIKHSKRSPRFTSAQQWLPISSTFGTLLPAGPHVIYWNIAVFGPEELTTDSGSLMLQASYPGIHSQVRAVKDVKAKFGPELEDADENGRLQKSEDKGVGSRVEENTGRTNRSS